jgi:hypothetical protein
MIKQMKDELESNDFELDVDHDLIERLRAEKSVAGEGERLNH